MMTTTMTQNYPGAGTSFNGLTVEAMESELREISSRVDGIRTRMRSGVDLVGLLFLALCCAGVVVMAVLAVAGFTGGDAGIGMLFTALLIVFLPLVGFSAVRALAPIARLRRELAGLRTRGEDLRRTIDDARAPAYTAPRDEPTTAPVVRPVEESKPAWRGINKRATSAPLPVPVRAPHRPSWWSPSGLSQVKRVQAGSDEILPPKRMLGWGAILLIGLFMALFAVGIIAGILTRAT